MVRKRYCCGTNNKKITVKVRNSELDGNSFKHYLRSQKRNGIFFYGLKFKNSNLVIFLSLRLVPLFRILKILNWIDLFLDNICFIIKKLHNTLFSLKLEYI